MRLNPYANFMDEEAQKPTYWRCPDVGKNVRNVKIIGHFANRYENGKICEFCGISVLVQN